MHVIKDEVVGRFHCSVDCLSVAFNVVGEVAGDVGSSWKLAGADGVWVNRSCDWAFPTVKKPMSTNILIQVVLAAVSSETIGTASRANHHNRVCELSSQ